MDSGLTENEQRVMDLLVEAWNAFCKLPIADDDDIMDFRKAIHDAERIMACRAFAREHPKYWRQE